MIASESVCAGLSAEQLRELELHYRLPGEAGQGHSVYRITFADGAQYVGITKRGVVDRLEQHLGADPWGQDTAPPPLTAYRYALGTLAIVTRVAAGVRWTIEVIDSGLEEQEARQREKVEIARLTRPLNGSGPVRPWSDPMAPDPKYGAVARFLHGVDPPPPKSISAKELPQFLSMGWKFLEPGPRPGLVRVTPQEGGTVSPALTER